MTKLDFISSEYKTIYHQLVEQSVQTLSSSYLQGQILLIKMLIMLVAIILIGCNVYLGDLSKEKVLNRTPPTLLEFHDSSCPSQSTIDIVDKEKRRTREILNNN